MLKYFQPIQIFTLKVWVKLTPSPVTLKLVVFHNTLQICGQCTDFAIHIYTQCLKIGLRNSIAVH